MSLELFSKDDVINDLLSNVCVLRVFDSPDNSLPECIVDCTADGKNDGRRLQHAFGLASSG